MNDKGLGDAYWLVEASGIIPQRDANNHQTVFVLSGTTKRSNAQQTVISTTSIKDLINAAFRNIQNFNSLHVTSGGATYGTFYIDEEKDEMVYAQTRSFRTNALQNELFTQDELLSYGA